MTCDNGGTCEDGIAEYTCTCVNGFVGEHCETSKLEIQKEYMNESEIQNTMDYSKTFYQPVSGILLGLIVEEIFPFRF